MKIRTLQALVPRWLSPCRKTSPFLGSMIRIFLSLQVVASSDPFLEGNLKIVLVVCGLVVT